MKLDDDFKLRGMEFTIPNMKRVLIKIQIASYDDSTYALSMFDVTESFYRLRERLRDRDLERAPLRDRERNRLRDRE